MNVNNYNDLVKRTVMFRSFQTSALNDEKRGVPALLVGRQSQIASTLSWQVESWMAAAHKLQWCEQVEMWLERFALEWLEMSAEDRGEPEGDAADEDWWDAKAEQIARHIAAGAMQIIFSGVDSSSNPMTMLDSRQKVEAAKAAIEAFTNLSRYNLTSSNAMDDVFEGIAYRETEREAARGRMVARVVLDKCLGKFEAIATNHRGERIATKSLHEYSRKGDAKLKAQEWADELRTKLNADDNGSYGRELKVEAV